MPMIPKGFEFKDPNSSQGYRLIKDVYRSDIIKSTDVDPFGGAPSPVTHQPVPKYMSDQIRSFFSPEPRLTKIINWVKSIIR